MPNKRLADKARGGARQPLPRGITMRNGRYRVRVTYEGQIYDVGSFETLALAKVAYEKERGRVVAETFVPPAERRRALREARQVQAAQAVTLAAWAEDWLRQLHEAGRSDSSVESYRSTLRKHILPALGARRMATIAPGDIDVLLASTREHGPSVPLNVYRTLSALFNAAVVAKVGGLVASPLAEVAKPAARKGKRRTLANQDPPDAATVRAIFEAMPPDVALAVEIAYLCQLRNSEVLGLQRGDFEHLHDAERAVMHVRRQWPQKKPRGAARDYARLKTDEERDLVVPAHLLPMLVQHLQLHVGPGKDAPLFPSAQNRAIPMGHTTLGKARTAAVRAVGVDYTMHDLRHAGLTGYAQAGATGAETMRRGGHRSVEVAHRYQHATLQRDREVTRRFDEAVAAARTQAESD